jgi:ComF family protein
MPLSINDFLFALLPGICQLCDAKTHRQLDLCIACENDLPWLGQACSICSQPLPHGASTCGKCLTNRPIYSHCHSAFEYQYPVDKLILNFKSHRKLMAGNLLSNLLAKTFSPDHTPPDILVPMPLHQRALKARGFNQSTEIAKVLSKCLKIPMEHGWCQRVVDTQEQKSLSLVERAKNVKDAFSISSDLSGKSIGIVDDVVTTGASVNELSKVMKANGAGSVEVYCLARTPL